jgi:hypothetical protein
MTAAASSIATLAAGDADQASRGSGIVIPLLRLEGFAVFIITLAAYWFEHYSWPLFAALILAPDLAMLGYLAGPRAGARTYNLVHTYLAPLALVAIGHFAGMPLAVATGLIFIAHIGMDRALGFGLKYPDSFGDTHLGRGGRPGRR